MPNRYQRSGGDRMKRRAIRVYSSCIASRVLLIGPSFSWRGSPIHARDIVGIAVERPTSSWHSSFGYHHDQYRLRPVMLLMTSRRKEAILLARAIARNERTVSTRNDWHDVKSVRL